MPYRFKRKENVADSVVRIITEQTQHAARELSGGNPDIHEGVHTARKCFKKVRSMLRLVRGELGDDTYRKENSWFRDSAHRLAGARDAEALVETFDVLAECHSGVSDCGPLTELRASLVARRQRIVAEQQDLSQRARELAGELNRMPERLGDWRFRHEGFKAISPGLARSYRRGRKAFRRAMDKPDDERFHEWRKRVKDYWYHSRLLRRVWPEMLEARVGELSRLADLLGDDHDLALLRATLAREGESLGAGAPLLAGLALQHQQKLRAEAASLGSRLYTGSPECLVGELAGLWDAWKSP